MPELISPRRRRTFTKAMGERKEHGGEEYSECRVRHTERKTEGHRGNKRKSRKDRDI